MSEANVLVHVDTNEWKLPVGLMDVVEVHVDSGQVRQVNKAGHSAPDSRPGGECVTECRHQLEINDGLL